MEQRSAAGAKLPARAPAGRAPKNTIMKPSSPSISTLEKTVRFLAGFLVSLFVIAILLKIFSDFSWALIVGSIANLGASYYIFTQRKNDQRLRMVAVGAIVGNILMVIAAASLWAFIQSAFQGIAD